MPPEDRLVARWRGDGEPAGVGLHLLAAAALPIGLLLFALVTWSSLPDPFPVHVDGAGNPDRWATRESGEWLLLAAMGLTMAAMQIGLALALPRIPLRYWNLPHKRALAALPAERLRPVVRVAQKLVLELSLGMSATLWAVQLAMWTTARGGDAGAWEAPILLCLALTVVVAGWRTVVLWRFVNRVARPGAEP